MVTDRGLLAGTIIVVGLNLLTSPKTAFFILIFLIVLQSVESMILDPRVVGRKLGLNPVLTLMSVSLGGKFFGIAGMILGAPVVGVIKLYATRFINATYNEKYAESPTATDPPPP